MVVPKKTEPFRHREAYCLMKYASDGGQVVEWIWNSRDGVTPFIVRSRCGKEMRHVQWVYDIRIIDYYPLPGERIFVDATPELLKPKAEEMVRKAHPTAGGQAFEELVTAQIRMWLTMPGAPMVIEVGGTYEAPSLLSKAIEAARNEAEQAGR